MEDLTSGQLEAATKAIDEANGADPNTLEVRGRSGPKELLHSEMMTDWVRRLDPDADAAQLVAARAHHLRRWTHPRDAYPQGRAGYRRWRTAAARAQAEEVASILLGIGAGPHFIERVGDIIRKRGLGSDPAVQTHEDALCLVFLETQLDDGYIGIFAPEKRVYMLWDLHEMVYIIHGLVTEPDENGRLRYYADCVARG